MIALLLTVYSGPGIKAFTIMLLGLSSHHRPHLPGALCFSARTRPRYPQICAWY